MMLLYYIMSLAKAQSKPKSRPFSLSEIKSLELYIKEKNEMSKNQHSHNHNICNLANVREQT